MAKLRGKQLEAIKMIAAGISTPEIESVLGIRPSTLGRWRSMPKFIARLEERKLAFAEDTESARLRLMHVLTEQYGNSMQSQLHLQGDSRRLQTCLSVLKFAANPPKVVQTDTNLHKLAQTRTNLHEISPKQPKSPLLSSGQGLSLS